MPATPSSNRDDAALLQLAPIEERPFDDDACDGCTRRQILAQSGGEPSDDDEAEDDQTGEDRPGRALLLPDDSGKDAERKQSRDWDEARRARSNERSRDEGGIQRHTHDERGDRIGRQSEAPTGRVRAPAVEAMEQRPYLSEDRGDPARELDLERQTRGLRHQHGREPLGRVEDAANDARTEAHGLYEIAPAELARAGGPEIDAVQARDPVRKGDGADQVARDHGGDGHAGILWPRGRLPVLPDRRGQDPGEDRVRGRRRRRDQRRLPARS